MKFVVDGEPTGKGRPRFSRHSNYVITYTDGKTAMSENIIRIEYIRQCGNIKHETGALSISVIAYCGIPSQKNKKTKAAMESGEIRPTKKPDASNILKLIEDALNGVAYRDDSQITDARIEKYYSIKPRLEIQIESLGVNLH
ncbi:MAG: RusA family crossover junction endodeoxyribonuclease [Oscillospiraceae bacterium]|jgi:Holliday junction resolvase RusA-like endonuclease|nr:RusA family crossover junction endodeoxyribonuclease [Oscillospiraceae bacterium]